MADSAIEWTDTTWNPTTGCDRVSPGCDNCYALTLAKRLKGMGQAKYQRDGDPRTSGPGFGLTVHEDTLTAPLRWRKPRRVFVNSMSDLFHKDVPDAFIAEVFATMARTGRHTYQILTKRHGRMRSLLNRPSFRDNLAAITPYWPLPNVWLGVSVEDQKHADLRVSALLETPAAVRFLSCEPLLGPVHLASDWLTPRVACSRTGAGMGREDLAALAQILRAAVRKAAANGGEQAPGFIDWVIVGGESGPGARPMHPGWARTLRDQCSAAGVPFFFKQWGEWGPAPFVVRVCDPATGWQGTAAELVAAQADAEAKGATHVHTGNPYRGPDGQTVWHVHEIDCGPPWSMERHHLTPPHEPIRRWGKKVAGRELDGCTYDEYPAVST